MQSSISSGLWHPARWCWRVRPAEQRGHNDGSFEKAELALNDRTYSNIRATATQHCTSRLPSLWKTMRL